MRIFDDDHHLGKYSREKELKQREKLYRWEVEEMKNSLREKYGFHTVKCNVTLSIPKRQVIIIFAQ